MEPRGSAECRVTSIIAVCIIVGGRASKTSLEAASDAVECRVERAVTIGSAGWTFRSVVDDCLEVKSFKYHVRQSYTLDLVVICTYLLVVYMSESRYLCCMFAK